MKYSYLFVLFSFFSCAFCFSSLNSMEKQWKETELFYLSERGEDVMRSIEQLRETIPEMEKDLEEFIDGREKLKKEEQRRVDQTERHISWLKIQLEDFEEKRDEIIDKMREIQKSIQDDEADDYEEFEVLEVRRVLVRRKKK